MENNTQTPPITPLHIRRSSQSDQKSPTLSYRTHLRKRTSSFSSNHDRSPTTPHSHKRFSNASAFSGRLGTLDDELDEQGGDLGNLADELDFLEDDEYDQDEDKLGGQDIIRDSGIDVTYMRQNGKPEEPPDSWFSPTMDDVLDDLNKVVKQSEAVGDSTIPQYRTAMVKMLPFDDQLALETSAQRLNTSTNSMAAYVTKEAKTLQMLSISLFSPFGLRDMLDYQALEESLPLFDALIEDMAQPDQAFLQGIQKLAHETQNIIQSNASLGDTMQEFNRPITDASRHLREARKQVERYQQEQEAAETARLELSKTGINDNTPRAEAQCKEIVCGFEDFCESIRQTWTEAATAAAN